MEERKNKATEYSPCTSWGQSSTTNVRMEKKKKSARKGSFLMLLLVYELVPFLLKLIYPRLLKAIATKSSVEMEN